MAKILISYYSDYGEAMYDAITNTLLQNGNDIFRLNINNIDKVLVTEWGGISKIIDCKLLDDIKSFNPDFILNFNNCLPTNCYGVLKENCKIFLIDADAPAVAFWNKDIIYKYFNKIIFLGLQSYSKTMYERYLNCELTEKNYMYFPPATVIKSEKLKKDKNIAFIGSNFFTLEAPKLEEFYKKEAIKLYYAFKKNCFLSFEDALKIYPNCTDKLFKLVRAYYCGQERLKYLQQLTDLGLVYWGTRYWDHIAFYDFELAKCFDPTPITSIEENQSVYNSSKISVNISHPLAKTSFSWRVMDIMASDSCLLMEDKPDWRDLFEKYLSKEILDAIIYKDRFDMREKAKRLLKDEKLRQKCVNELNNAIEQNGRWETRFKELEQTFNINVLNLNNENVKYIRISTVSEKSTKKIIFKPLKIKNRLKIATYSLLLFLAQIPILDLLQRKEKRLNLRNKIDKYWR